MHRVFFALLVCGIAAQSARADVSYQYVSDQSNYNVAQGAAVTVNLYLAETVTPGNASGNYNQSLINIDGGLTGAGIFAKVANGSTATITGLSANVGSNGPNNFDTKSNAQFTSTQAAILEASTGSSNVFGTATNGNAVTSTTTNTVLLGTLTITAGASASGTTTFSLLSYAHAPSSLGGSGGDNNTTTAGATFPDSFGLDLDVTNNAGLGGPPPKYIGAGADSQLFQFTVNVSPVPEPSSLLLCGFAACGLGYGAWRRRKAARMAAADANTPSLGA